MFWFSCFSFLFLLKIPTLLSWISFSILEDEPVITSSSDSSFNTTFSSVGFGSETASSFIRNFEVHLYNFLHSEQFRNILDSVFLYLVAIPV